MCCFPLTSNYNFRKVCECDQALVKFYHFYGKEISSLECQGIINSLCEQNYSGNQYTTGKSGLKTRGCILQFRILWEIINEFWVQIWKSRGLLRTTIFLRQCQEIFPTTISSGPNSFLKKTHLFLLPANNMKLEKLP